MNSIDMKKKNYDILITPSSYGECGSGPLDLIDSARLTYLLNPHRRRLSCAELIELAEGCKWIIAGVEEYSTKVFKELPSLRIISRCGVGLDNIDLQKADELGISILNTPYGPTDAVAELAVGLVINILRKINLSDANIKMGKWTKFHGSLLRGKTVGIIGLGRIGKASAGLLSAFDTKIIFCDPNVEETTGADCSKVSLATLLGDSDIILIHASREGSAGYLIDRRELEAMKPGAYLVNLSRGGVVNEAALYESLANKRLAGAAVDVFENEPYSGELTKLDNIILTPHLGSYAREAKLKMEIDAVKNLLDAMEAV